MATVMDSYSESNQNGSEGTYSARPALGQSFTGDGGTLNSAVVHLSKSGSPTGNVNAKIYAHSGTFGTDGVPTGAVLATSDNFDVSTLTTSLELKTFNFTGANKIVLTNGTKYVLVIEYSAGNGTHFINWGVDTSSPSHGGNISRYTSGSWGADSTRDFCFYVYKDDASAPSVSASPSLSISPSASVSASPSISPSSSPSPSPMPGSGIFLKVSKPGVNVLTNSDSDKLIFSSEYGTLKYFITGTLTFTIDGDLDGALDSVGQASYTHNLTYYPYVEVYMLNPLGKYEYCPTNNGGAGTTWRTWFVVTTTQLKVYAQISGFSSGGVEFNFMYFIYKNNLGF